MRRYEFELCADQLLEVMESLAPYKDDPQWEGAYAAALNAYEVLVDSESALGEEQN